MPHRNLPGGIVARLQDGLLLSGALLYRGIAVIGLYSLEHAFTHQKTPDSPRQLRKPLLFFLRIGYWMLGGVTTGNWDTPQAKASSSKR